MLAEKPKACIDEIGMNEMPLWDEFVLSHEQGIIYHTSDRRKIIESAYGHQPVYLVLEEAADRSRGVIPFFAIKSNFTGSRLASLPCAQTCNPLVSSQRDYDLLIEFVTNYIKLHNIKYVELSVE